ncbi:MAG TPA: YicC family protein [Flavobacteriaceae bacterium]|nr:YicC family protein [Flavobacteriaceae bacterium]
MIKSMTGYGKTEFTINTKKITIEIKSLNSKNLDLNVRINNPYREKELLVRKKLSIKLIRGKVDFNLYVENTGSENTTKINQSIVKDYINQLENIQRSMRGKALEVAMTLPNVLDSVKEELNQDEWSIIETKIDKTLDKIDGVRLDEGSILKADFEKRITTLQSLCKNNIVFEEARIPAVRERIAKSINDLKLDVDKNRFEQELIFYLEKLDITEERIRLDNHLLYFLKELNSNESNGKKLGFICQEIGREINTTGSKANYAPMQQNVVLMKDELEKIKEQLLNVL